MKSLGLFRKYLQGGNKMRKRCKGAENHQPTAKNYCSIENDEHIKPLTRVLMIIGKLFDDGTGMSMFGVHRHHCFYNTLNEISLVSSYIL